MDDELHALEAELKRLHPAALSTRLQARVAETLTPAARQPGVMRWLWALLLPAAATAALIAGWPEPPSHRVPRPAGGGLAQAELLKPIAVENVLYAAHDEGIVTLADGTPARRQRLSYLDTVTWKNPRTNASLVWSVPREEIRIVPVALQ